MDKHKVDINEVLAAIKAIEKFNSMNLDSVDFYDGENKLIIDATHQEQCHHYGIKVPSFIQMFIK